MMTPRCHHHGCLMVAHTELVGAPKRGYRRPKRLVYRCPERSLTDPRRQCEWVAIGLAEYEPTYEQVRREGWLKEL